jgi:hypothetical protein
MSTKTKRQRRGKRSFKNRRGVSRNATGMTTGMAPRAVAQKRTACIQSQTNKGEVTVYDTSQLPAGSKLLHARDR